MSAYSILIAITCYYSVLLLPIQFQYYYYLYNYILYIYIYIYIYIGAGGIQHGAKHQAAAARLSEKGEVLLRGVGTLRYFSTKCICAVAA